MNSKQRLVVALLALLNFTHILDFMIMMPLGNILMDKWGLNTTEFSHIVAAYPLTAFLSSFSAIFFADKFDRKHLLLFAYGGFLLLTLGCATATGYTSMMLMRVGTGLFGGLIGAQVLSMVADYVEYNNRGKAMGLLMGGFALASIIGVPFSLFLANHYTWQMPFILIGTLGIILFFILLKVLPNFKYHLATPSTLAERVSNFKHIFTNRTQIIALLLSSGLMMGHFFVIPLINPYMVKNALVPQSSTPLIYLVGGVASIIVSTIGGRLADKHGKLIVFLVGALASLPLIYMVTNMPAWPVWVILSIFGLWFGASTLRSVPSQAMISQSVTAHTRGSFMSFNSCVQQVGTGIATLTSGWLTYNDASGKIFGYHKLGYISIGVIIICMFLGNLLNNKLKTN
jgi:MFS transporter, DHA1 family, inner membrane transport protein